MAEWWRSGKEGVLKMNAPRPSKSAAGAARQLIADLMASWTNSQGISSA
jgi:hypothetical protein